MKDKTFSILIPTPAELRETAGGFPLKKLTAFAVAEKFPQAGEELQKLFSTLAMNVEKCTAEAPLTVKEANLPPENWEMIIDETGIVITAGDPAGAFYAVTAFSQMMFAAAITGSPDAALDGVQIHDEPRFPVRSFLLDCARHFQEKEIVKKFIRILALHRINTFHWHLADSQGWRYASKVAPLLGSDGTVSPGQYTVEDIREISACAKAFGITIIPEVDVPGHSQFLLKHYPHLACDPQHPGSEVCIGSPETMVFLKKIFTELMELFPDSPLIHLGGDEASTAMWENCPKCRKALAEKGLSNMRELENAFMTELSRFIVEAGRTPILWGTSSGQFYPADTMIQVWLDIHEPLKIAPHGNKMIYSVHSSLYFDYPANMSEPWQSWMFSLDEKGVYMTDPHLIWPDRLKDCMAGPEACLWTETIPQHRIFAKLFPRIAAYSECAWSNPEHKVWSDYLRRREFLEAAGYFDHIKYWQPGSSHYCQTLRKNRN